MDQVFMLSRRVQIRGTLLLATTPADRRLIEEKSERRVVMFMLEPNDEAQLWLWV